MGTTIDVEGETAPTIGLDHESRTSEFLGVGGVAAYAGSDLDDTSVLAVSELHIPPRFIVGARPGVDPAVVVGAFGFAL